MKKALLISLILILAGCAGSLKNSWTNFRAYYNTYYNAKEHYRTGLEKVEEQPVELNVNEPIRVHRPPVSSSDQDFQNAIDKGAQILRKFPESKWMDETLELIGKSYYYRQEYYSALQKFEEQYSVAESSEMRQRAVIWKGRVLLDQELYNEGIVFLENELSRLSGEWNLAKRGEAEVLLAEHHVQLEEWEQASQYLADALPKMPIGSLKARAFFLHGQVLEINEQYGEASYAYDQAQQNRPGFELLYWANYKEAEVLRKMGNLDRAFAIYDQMRKDDKNVERLPDIYYQIARTEEARGNIDLARDIYKEVLYNETYQLSRKTQGDIYYRLGAIYTDYYNRYNLAAAYYDSSSSVKNSQQQAGVLEEQQNTQTLAKAYGQYSKLRSQIARLDSMLWLGSLPQSKLDSVIAVIENRRLKQMKQERQNRQDDQNVITNVSPAQSSGGDGRTSGAYGFLNYKNSRLMTEARVQFRAVWGDRALVDNWRRIEAVRSSSGQTQSTENTIAQQQAPQQAGPKEKLAVDLSEIPFTEKERQQTLDQMASSRYELGSLFQMTLQKPDSAVHYFRTVVDQHPDHELVPRAMYSLYELLSSQGASEQAEQWVDRLKKEYPDSRYNRQLKQRLGEQAGGQVSQDTTESSLSDRANRIISSQTSTEEIAKELRNLALTNKDARASSQVHYEAIRHYIKLAKERDTVSTIIPQPPVDSLTTDSLSADSLSQKPPKIEYKGAYWDSVRTVLNEHQQNFSGQNSATKAKKLSDELGEVKQDTSGISKQERNKSGMPTCQELGINPEIEQGMQQFLSSVEYPDNLADLNLSGSVEYAFTITASGQMESYELISKKTNLGIEEAFEKAFDAHLQFSPLSLDENTPKVRCQVSFPISR